MKRGVCVTFEAIRSAFAVRIIRSGFSMPTVDLSLIPSIQNGTRKAHIEKNILEKYYPDDTNLHVAYFSSCVE